MQQHSCNSGGLVLLGGLRPTGGGGTTFVIATDFPSGKALVHWKLTWKASFGWLGVLIPWGQGLTSSILNPSLYIGQGPAHAKNCF